MEKGTPWLATLAIRHTKNLAPTSGWNSGAVHADRCARVTVS